VIRRLFWALLGLGLGLVLGMRVVRFVDQTTDRARPTTLARDAGRTAGSWQARVSDAVAVGREAAAEREAAMRARWGVPTLDEAAAQAAREHPDATPDASPDATPGATPDADGDATPDA